ncbi:MAG TPA: hypothetical protein VFS64_00600 [Solirubrobacterales bacterium]|nr:hypothetical protein [Solirubrobacterales bacterium]
MAGALLALACFLSACGGGGDSTDATGSIAKAQLLKKGNVICDKGNEEIHANEERFLSEHRDDDYRGAMEDVLPVRIKELRLLRALGLPAEGAEQWGAMLDAMEEGIRRAKQDPHSLLAGGSDYAFARAYRVGLAYGLRKCWLA